MRIILSKEDLLGKRITIAGEKAHYLISVLRCKTGDDLQVFDGEGSFYKSKISEIDNKRVIIDLLEKVLYDTESPLNLILVQGILKGEKMDMIIQKATELGVKEIIPAITERSQIRQTRKTGRWRKIAEEASKQSGRTVIPKMHEPVELLEFLERGGDIGKGGRGDADMQRRGKMAGFIFWEKEGLSLAKVADSSIRPFTGSPLHVLIGPEGGFTINEVETAVSAGLIAVSLGKRILRAETASIAAVTLVQFLMGDIS